jgi:hypothetical protein
MSSSSRRGVLPALYGHEEEYELNFTYPERNPPGVFAYMTPNVMLDSKEVVDVVSVYKCAVDARDAVAMKAEMLEDGTGILVLLDQGREADARIGKERGLHRIPHAGPPCHGQCH